MPLVVKKIIMSFLGLLGALMLWPFLLLAQYWQASFPGFLSFSLAQGALFGLVFGAVFGSLEGIAVSSRPKALKGALMGCAFGVAAGVAGMLAGQAFLFLAGQSAGGMALALCRGAAWVIVALLLAMTEGLRARSLRRALVGALGGLAGGVVGGAALELAQSRFPGDQYALLAALSVFGLALAFIYASFERGFSSGALKILNGPLKGKEYLIVSRKAVIGSADSCDIVLKGYPGVAARHALIQVVKGKARVSPVEGKVAVNEEPAEDRALRREDFLAVGKAKFVFGHFS